MHPSVKQQNTYFDLFRLLKHPHFPLGSSIVFVSISDAVSVQTHKRTYGE